MVIRVEVLHANNVDNTLQGSLDIQHVCKAYIHVLQGSAVQLDDVTGGAFHMGLLSSVLSNMAAEHRSGL